MKLKTLLVHYLKYADYVVIYDKDFDLYLRAYVRDLFYDADLSTKLLKCENQKIMSIEFDDCETFFITLDWRYEEYEA